jgi:ABC-type dipeptide/oligopeptide/nickel transport system permease subunit
MANLTPSVQHAPEGGEIGPVSSGWRLALREFAGNRLAIVGFGTLLFFVVFSFLGPYVYHSDTATSNLMGTNLGPGAGHPLGTDDQGLDVLGELMQGGQVSIEVGLLSAFIALIVGAAWGAVSGLAGGFVDSSMMRVVDILLSVPPLFIILIVADRYGATVIGLSVIIGGFTWLVPARLIRGEVLSLKTRDFVLAARSAGSGWWRLINRHLLPNALSVIVVNATFNVADAILFVSYLGILGFGLHYPILDWGDMISNGVSYMQDGYWWQIYPVGFCIVAFVMACNFVGDALRDALDVRLRRR